MIARNFLLPPRWSFVIVKFSSSSNLSRNMNISVRCSYHMILENVCMDVCVCIYVYRFISGSTPSILTGWGSFFFFLISNSGKKSFLLTHWFVFVLCRIFDFWKIDFYFFFLIIGLKFLSRVGSIRKSIKNLYLKKNNFSSYRGSFVITKNVFFFYKLITPKLDGQCFGEKSW